MVRIKSIGNSKYLDLNSSNTKIKTQMLNVFILNIYLYIAIFICVILPREFLNTAIYYCIVILSAVMFAAIAQKSRTPFFFNIFLGLSLFVLYFNLGFRNFSGIDDAAYIRIFEDVNRNGWLNQFLTTTMEPGYLILNEFVSLFTNNYLVMQLVTSFIPLLLFYRAFKKYRNVINIPMAVFLLSTMLYFQILSVALVRMFIALGIIFNAYHYILQKKAVKYVLFVLLASLFHYSALFMLILTYFAINKNNLSKKAKRFLVISLILIPVLFVSVSTFIVPLLGDRYSNYGSLNNLSLSLSSFDTLPLLLLLLLFYNRFSGESKLYYKLFLSIFALSSVLSFYSSMVPLGRLIFYANTSLFIAAPMVSKMLENEEKNVIFSGIIILYGFIYVYWTQFSLDSHIPYLFPYRNIFFEF